MKAKIATAGLLIGAMLVPYVSAAEDKDSDRSHPVTFVKDSAITTKVKAKLAAEHITSMGRIHVDTDAKGVVYLSGTARSQEAIDKAVEIAKNTKRVTSVDNKLTIKADD